MRIHPSVAILERFTRKEAAKYLGVSPQALANWAHNGKVEIPYHKMGTKVIYMKEDLDNYLSSTRRVKTCG